MTILSRVLFGHCDADVKVPTTAEKADDVQRYIQNLDFTIVNSSGVDDFVTCCHIASEHLFDSSVAKDACSRLSLLATLEIKASQYCSVTISLVKISHKILQYRVNKFRYKKSRYF